MFLLIVIYIAFIGLGVPDSLIGSAWPAIYKEWAMPEYAVSLITLTISGCTVLSSIFSTGVLNRFGTHKVSAVSTAMTAAALLGFSFAPNFVIMWLCAIPLGVGAGAIDATAMGYLNDVYEDCKKKNIQLVFSHVNDQPLSLMKKNKNLQKVGEENFCPNIDSALKRAEAFE